MLPDRVSNPGPLTYESGALPIALRGPADNGRARAYCACSRCEWGLFRYIFSLAYHFSFLSSSVWNGWMGNLWFKSFSTEF